MPRDEHTGRHAHSGAVGDAGDLKRGMRDVSIQCGSVDIHLGLQEQAIYHMHVTELDGGVRMT